MPLSILDPSLYTPEARKARRQAIGDSLAAIDKTLALRPDPTVDVEAERAVSRRYGKQIGAIALKIGMMIEDSGAAFKGFRYSPDHYRSAAARLEELADAKERIDETSQRIGLEMRALRVELGQANDAALQTKDGILLNHALPEEVRNLVATAATPVKAHLASRSAAVARATSATRELKAEAREAKEEAAEAKAEVARLRTERRHEPGDAPAEDAAPALPRAARRRPASDRRGSDR